MKTERILQTLKEADFEIDQLRRRNEILAAKVEMIDLFACVLKTQPAARAGGAMSPDIRYTLMALGQDLEREEAEMPQPVAVPAHA